MNYISLITSAVYFSVKHKRKVSNSFNIQSEFSIRQQELLHSNRLDFRLEKKIRLEAGTEFITKTWIEIWTVLLWIES